MQIVSATTLNFQEVSGNKRVFNIPDVANICDNMHKNELCNIKVKIMKNYFLS